MALKVGSAENSDDNSGRHVFESHLSVDDSSMEDGNVEILIVDRQKMEMIIRDLGTKFKLTIKITLVL